MTAEEYLHHMRKELHASLLAARAGAPDMARKHRTEGLMQAARLLGLASADVLEQMIEQEHLKVFGESVATRRARRARKDALSALKQQCPDAYFDIPAIERR